jgi:hypothetical protein
VNQDGGDDIVPISEGVCFNGNCFVKRPLDRKTSSINLRLDALDHHTRAALLGEMHRMPIGQADEIA